MYWPHREQARSYRVLRCVEDLGQSAIHCGSEPARDGGVSGDIDGECARDGGVSGDIDGECTGLIAGKPAPTGFCGVSRIWVSPQSIVGVSLLAMAVYLATLMVNVLASSRAS